MRIGRGTPWSRWVASGRRPAIVLRRVSSLRGLLTLIPLTRRRRDSISGKRILPTLLLLIRLVSTLEYILTDGLQSLFRSADEAGSVLTDRLAGYLSSCGDLVLLLGGLLPRPASERTDASPGIAESLLELADGIVGTS